MLRGRRLQDSSWEANFVQKPGAATARTRVRACRRQHAHIHAMSGAHPASRPRALRAWARTPTVLVAALLGAAATCAAGVLATGSAVAHTAHATAEARAAHVLNVKDEGHLHLVHESGSELVEEGSATGTVPGTVRVSFNVGATVSGQFTIYARGGGSITGHGSGSLRSTGAYSTFGGSLEVTGGSGRFRHAHGSGNIYGAINRRTYAMTVQTVGKLNY